MTTKVWKKGVEVTDEINADGDLKLMRMESLMKMAIHQFVFLRAVSNFHFLLHQFLSLKVFLILFGRSRANKVQIPPKFFQKFSFILNFLVEKNNPLFVRNIPKENKSVFAHRPHSQI